MFGQFADSFNDGDFTTNPEWIGHQTKFDATANQLKLSAPALAGSCYLSTASEAINNATWEFSIRLEFNPSSTNYARVYLVSDNSDLSAALNGYFVMIGNTADEVSLYRQNGATKTEIIDGLDSRLNLSIVNLRVKVTRSALGEWQLFSDVGITGNFISEGQTTDGSNSITAYFGIYCEYTSTRSDKFSFDDFIVSGVGPIDQTRPLISSVEPSADNQLTIKFSESINPATLVVNNFLVTHVGQPVSINLTSETEVTLIFNASFQNGVESVLHVENILDLSGNMIASKDIPFFYFHSNPVSFKDIVITEIFADFSPVIGLPEAEFIELYNRSSHPIDLSAWKFSDETTTSSLTAHILLPGHYLILTSNSNVSALASYGSTMGVTSFPTLNNSGDKLKLADNAGIVVDSVNYSAAWYHDEEKDGGGWSLELIDPDNFCLNEANWLSSMSMIGGTPGNINSVDKDIVDSQGPMLLSATQVDEHVFTLVFDENVSVTVPAIMSVKSFPSLKVNKIEVESNSLRVTAEEVISSGKTYLITVEDVFDCSGNEIEAANSTAKLNLDETPPTVSAITTVSQNQLRVSFSENVNQTINQVDLITISETNEHPSYIEVIDEKTIDLYFAIPFVNGSTLHLSISSFSDWNGNTSHAVIPFNYFVSSPVATKDIVFTEIMPDPIPSIGLPEVEFVEICNRSKNPIDLSGWSLSDGSTSSILPSVILMPNKFLVLCPSTAAKDFDAYGDIMPLSKFPSLNNDGDQITLKNPQGISIDSVAYRKEWYREIELSEGGRSLELIDPDNVCGESENWTASEAEQGGTPGSVNSTNAERPDLSPPEMLRVVVESTNVIRLDFAEKLSAQLPLPTSFKIVPDVTVERAAFVDQSLRSMRLYLQQDLRQRTLYTIGVTALADCAGNSEHTTQTFAMPEAAQVGDLVINEVLFNPFPGGVDFIEVYNKSDKYIMLSSVEFASVNEASLSNRNNITNEQLLIGPTEYIAFTTDLSILQHQFPQSDKRRLLLVEDLPSLPDDEGHFALVSEDLIIDQLHYTRSMHSVFLKDDEGVSLERISFDVPTNTHDNWKSASAFSGYGTPGGVNSNVRISYGLDESVVIDPRVFQPGSMDKDFTLIRYNFQHGGWIANVKVFDAEGRHIKTIAENQLLSAEGFMRWDGDRDDGHQSRIGYYMIQFEVFDDKGSMNVFRKGVAIAAKF